MRALGEDGRTRRRTIGDALEVVRQQVGLDEIERAEIKIGQLFQLPYGECTAIVVVAFPDLACYVSLPSAGRFSALPETDSQRKMFEICRLDEARVCPDGSVVLGDESRLRAVEVVPTHLKYHLSALEERIFGHVIAITNASCFRRIRELLPEHLRDRLPDFLVPDYSNLHTIQVPPLKVIRAEIAERDPGLQMSNQKIADTLAWCGMRSPTAPSAESIARHNLNGIATIRLGSGLLTLRDF